MPTATSPGSRTTPPPVTSSRSTTPRSTPLRRFRVGRGSRPPGSGRPTSTRPQGSSGVPVRREVPRQAPRVPGPDQLRSRSSRGFVRFTEPTSSDLRPWRWARCFRAPQPVQARRCDRPYAQPRPSRAAPNRSTANPCRYARLRAIRCGRCRRAVTERDTAHRRPTPTLPSRRRRAGRRSCACARDCRAR